MVHGRFHIFELAQALLERGHDVTVFTNYPARFAKRYGVPADRVRSFLAHGVLSRVAARGMRWMGRPYPEALHHRAFGMWAARALRGERWDMIHVLSGVAEEILLQRARIEGIVALGRLSTHIRTQADLLEQEERRAGVNINRPSEWMIAREEREYALADRIMVLSSFSRDTFLARGFDPERIEEYHIAADSRHFRINPEQAQARLARILDGEPLRLLYVGTLSHRKGLVDLIELAELLDSSRFRLRMVGPVLPEAVDVVRRLPEHVEWVPKQPQLDLARQYAWGDVFVFPTIEDGAPYVLVQAQAAGLLLLTTPHCSGPDIIQEGETGWVLPIRAPEAFAERLRWADAHRAELATMSRRVYEDFRPLEWVDVAIEFEDICERLIHLPKRRAGPAPALA